MKTTRAIYRQSSVQQYIDRVQFSKQARKWEKIKIFRSHSIEENSAKLLVISCVANWMLTMQKIVSSWPNLNIIIIRRKAARTLLFKDYANSLTNTWSVQHQNDGQKIQH